MNANSKNKDIVLKDILDSATKTSDRKLEHIKVCLEKNVEGNRSYFQDFSFVHQAIPDFNLADIDLEIEIFGKKLHAPLIASAITGGHEVAKQINRNIAQTIENLGLGMSVGSQRAALEDDSLISTFSVAREEFPNGLIIGNIGAPQLLDPDYTIHTLEKAVKMIDADALAIHLNPLQEACQWEGDTDFTDITSKVKDISTSLSVPLIIKEVGSGISKELAKSFSDSEIGGIEICGLGGTSWALVESYRAKDDILRQIGQTFKDWGIPTPLSILEVKQHFKGPIIGSGGVRTGVDAAKAIALGASLAGIALPVLKHVHTSSLQKYFTRIIKELKIAMFLVGAKTIPELQQKPLIVTGKSLSWMQQRNLSLSH